MSNSHTHNLTLQLRGEIPLEKFERAVSAFIDLIQEVTRETLTEDHQIRWTAAVKEGSAMVIAIPNYEREVEAEALEILKAVPFGINAIEHGADELPPHFNRDAANAVKRLAIVRGLRGEDITSINVRNGSASAKVTARSVASVDALIGGQRQSYGSIEGKMQTITERGGFRFVVYDSIADRRTDCFIDESLLEQALANFRRRVRVSGMVQYDRLGDPVSIKVEGIYVFRPNSELPSVSEMKGILK